MLARLQGTRQLAECGLGSEWTTAVQGLAVWGGAQARCDFAEALRFPAVLQCGAQQILLILLILLPSDCNNTEMFYNPEGNRK